MLPASRRNTGLLVRPRLGPLRSYLRPRAAEMTRPKKSKSSSKKSSCLHKMDSLKKRTPDYTDIAYREAVARLRYLLAESYSPQATPTKIPHVHTNKADDSGDETDASIVMSERSRQVSYRTPFLSSKRVPYMDSLPKLSHGGSTINVPGSTDMVESTAKATDGQQPPPELMAFIERQEEYIEQLEKESQYCREELSNLLSKVKDVICENEGLHEKEKSGLLKSVFDSFESGEEEDQDMEQEKDDNTELPSQPEKKNLQPSKKKRLEGPSIVFESRISELEAQLTQTKIDLRKAQEEAEMYKKKLAEVQPHSMETSGLPPVDSYRQQIESLQREKEELTENLSKLSSAVTQIREKESDASHKVKRSLDLVDQAQFEKAQAELETRRLKEELDRQHDKLRDLLQEQGRRVQDERAQAERRYAQQLEQLSADLTIQWDTASKLQLELEKQRRTEGELRRELQQKNVTIEELKKELQTKIAGLQSEATQSAVERGSLEQELAASRLAAERAERELRQESARLQAEVVALRQRLDRADSDLLHSRRENLRLSEQVAALEREVNLAKMVKENTEKDNVTSTPSKSSREKELTSMLMDMEAKHVHTVAELENMIQTQNQVVEKLKDECHSLTQKLEESSARHKEDRAVLRMENTILMEKLEQVWTNCKQLGVVSGGTSAMEEQTTPMLRDVIQDPSMALKHSMSHSCSLNISHRQCTIPKENSFHNQDIRLSQNSPYSQDISPIQNYPRSQDISMSQKSHHSQHISYTKNFLHKQGISLSQKSPHNWHISRTQNFLHSQDFNLNQNSLSQNIKLIQNFPHNQDMNPRKNSFHSQHTSHKQNISCSQGMKSDQSSSLNRRLNPSRQVSTHSHIIHLGQQEIKLCPVWDLGTNQPMKFRQVLGQRQPVRLQQVLSLFPTQALGVSQTLDLSLNRTQSRLSADHLPLSPWRREVDHPPLTLEDLATDSDSYDSQSAQLEIFR